MTEVTPETPMEIQEEEIRVEDVVEHLINILDISEQSSKFLDLSTDTQMEGWTSMNLTSTQRGNRPLSLNIRHPTFPCSLTGTGNPPATTKYLLPMVAWVDLTKEEFQQWKINPEVGQTIMDFNTPRRHLPFKTPSTGSSLMSNESYQELMAFKKAAKRDTSAFDILKDEKYYDVFYR